VAEAHSEPVFRSASIAMPSRRTWSGPASAENALREARLRQAFEIEDADLVGGSYCDLVSERTS
jgi:hypothetical protein